MNKPFYDGSIFSFFVVLFLCCIITQPLKAQQYSQMQSGSNTLHAEAYATGPVSLFIDGKNIQLWGVEAPEGATTSLKLNARSELGGLIGGSKIRCVYKGIKNSVRQAQCLSVHDTDLALYMIQNGYALVDRTVIYGTVFQDPYINAEGKARQRHLGIWSDEISDHTAKSVGFGVSYPLLFIIYQTLICVLICIVIYLLVRNTGSSVNALQEILALIRSEHRIKDKEKFVIISVLETEIQANKNKIDAYLAIHREMLKNLENTAEQPKYQQSGDIVQRQPALDRVIFDSHTDRVEMLGKALASKVIHFYARIKTTPEYITLEPDVPLEEAQAMVREIVEKTETMANLSADIISRMQAPANMVKKRTAPSKSKK